MTELREATAPNRIKELRKSMDLSQDELGAALAEALGRDKPIPQQQISKWEEGGELKVSTLRGLADVFGCAEQDIIGKPSHPSRDGWIGPAGTPPRPNTRLLQRCIEETQILLDRTGRKADAARFAAMVSELYALALEDSAQYGVPAEEVELRRFWRLMQP